MSKKTRNFTIVKDTIAGPLGPGYPERSGGTG